MCMQISMYVWKAYMVCSLLSVYAYSAALSGFIQPLHVCEKKYVCKYYRKNESVCMPVSNYKCPLNFIRRTDYVRKNDFTIDWNYGSHTYIHIHNLTYSVNLESACIQ